MKNEFVLAFNEVLEEKGLPKEIVMEALQAALASAYRRHVNASNAQQVEAHIDSESGRVNIYAEKEVVEEVEDDRTEVTLVDALKVNNEAAIGDMVVVETTPNNFGRVAAQTARQVIQQRIREAERDAQLQYYSKQLGEILSGIVQAVNPQFVTLGLEMKAEGQMPRNQQIPGERFRVHDRVRALLLEVKTTPRGPQIILSRAHRNFLRRLLENEVPEIYHGLVEIRSIAREPGQRSKVAVGALQAGVDPVGACVGIRGVRIQAIVRELNDEKIDVIEWNSDPAVYIAKALSPARVTGVYLNEQTRGVKTATVVVPEDQLSLAIGRDGQNARLAAKLTAWKIDIKSLPEAAADSLNKLTSDPDYALIAESEVSTVPLVEAVLAKKSEGRPVTPEEYHLLTQFVDRVERGLIRQRETELVAAQEQIRIASANIPPKAFQIALEDFNISERVYEVISESGLQTVGDVILQMELDEDAIWKLSGMGPKAMQELKAAIDEINLKLKTELEAEIVGIELPLVERAEVEPVALAEAMEPELDVLSPQTEVLLAPDSETIEPAPTEALDVELVALTGVGPEIELQETAIEEVAAEVEAAEPRPETGENEEEPSLDQIFALRPEVLEYNQTDEDEDFDENSDQKKKKGKKKKKFVEVVYDPDKDVVVVMKKHKRGEEDWGDTW